MKNKWRMCTLVKQKEVRHIIYVSGCAFTYIKKHRRASLQTGAAILKYILTFTKKK